MMKEYKYSSSTAPERIFLQDAGDYENACEISWHETTVDENDTGYVRDDIVATLTATIASQEIRIEALTKALEPFANAVKMSNDLNSMDNQRKTRPHDFVTIDEFRAAALAAKEGE